MLQKLTNYLQSANYRPAGRGLFGLGRTTWLPVLFFVGISLVLAGRTLYTAPDDRSYIAYFEGAPSNIHTHLSYLFYILEEPLWSSYTSFMGDIFGAKAALRITIFISSLIFLVASSRLAPGAWIFILFAFVMDSTFATQMYYNQIRQGFALSIFLMMIAGGLSPFLGAVVAATIHSAFITVIPCTIAAVVAKKSNIILIAILLTIVMGCYYLRNLIGDINIGRRMTIYDLKGKSNILFYALVIVQYGLIFFLLKNKHSDDRQELWYRFALIFFVSAICLSIIHEAGGRLMYIANALVMILIGLNLKRSRARLGAVAWLLFLFVIVINEGTKGSFGPGTWVGRWVLILSGR